MCTILDKFPRNYLITKVQITNKRFFPLNIKLDFNFKIVQAQPTLITQDADEKVSAFTQTTFQAEIKDKTWL